MYLSNLWKAIVQLIEDSEDYKSLLLNLDRLGNALAAGDYRATVSARVGYHAIKLQAYWLCLEWIIDQTFRPIDGRNHCLMAYEWEEGKGIDHRRGNDIALFGLSLLVLVCCLVLAPVIWIISQFLPEKTVSK